MNSRRITPDVVASDPEQARKFYTEVLGLVPAMELGWITTFVSPSEPLAQLNVINGQDAAAGDCPAPQISIEVEDVDEIYARSLSAGWEIVYPLTDEEWPVRRFFVRGPDGVVINVMRHLTDEEVAAGSGGASEK